MPFGISDSGPVGIQSFVAAHFWKRFHTPSHDLEEIRCSALISIAKMSGLIVGLIFDTIEVPTALDAEAEKLVTHAKEFILTMPVIDNSKGSLFGTSSNVIVAESGQLELKEEWDYEPIIDELSQETKQILIPELVKVSPSTFVEFAIKVPDKLTQKYVDFDFEKRRYLRLPYDTPSKRVLLKTGRQVEKTISVVDNIITTNGMRVPAKDIKVGTLLPSMAIDGAHIVYNPVTWVSRRYTKPCVEIETRQRHKATIALTHPMRTWDSWTVGADLKVGDRIAVVRKCGQFTGECIDKSDERIRFTAYMIGDGHLGDSYYNFTSLPGVKLEEFKADLSAINTTFRVDAKRCTEAVSVRMHKNGPVIGWMKEDGLHDTRSDTKFIPSWVFDLSKEKTALFLNRLWSTDGSVKTWGGVLRSVYCSISERLIKDVQSLLWKFGIPSRIRENWPSVYKKRGEKKIAYILHIETQGGIRTFINEIGAIGKTEGVSAPSSKENNNRDTLPIEANDIIHAICQTKQGQRVQGKTLHSVGLRETLKYPLTWEKLQRYVEFFRAYPEIYDQSLVDKLAVHLNTDLFWDEIVKITSVGDKECVDFEVDATHNFIVEGMVSHNSTLLGNKALAYCCINNSITVLYVSPTNLQSKTFSNDRIKEPMETSPVLKAWTTTETSDSVFFKQFVNKSKILLRYAYLNADRCRGVSADIINLDEIQDINTDHIPVIEAAASHSPYEQFIYSGTPKSTDNPIEKYWSDYSTQNEWVIPCDRHGPPGGGVGRYWNIVGEKNIGLKHLICDRCGEQIFPNHPDAQWASMNISASSSGKIIQPFEGFHISQLMVPWIKWDSVVHKHRTAPRAVFFNEVMGESYDSGNRPLVKQDLIDNCRPNFLMTPEFLTAIKNKLGGGSPIFAGIDWGCHDDQTRILTEAGFKYFKDLTDEDKVAQWDPDTREMDFTIPEARTVRDWDKPLYHFRRIGYNLMVTDTHRMRVQNTDGTWVTETCAETIKRTEPFKVIGYVKYGEEILPKDAQGFLYGKDLTIDPKLHIKEVPYAGKVYCCKVPKGYIVTERNGCLAFQGNTGEGSYTVLSLGAYIDGFFTIFYIHRFEGEETEPPVQLDLIEQLVRNWNVMLIGTDHGGGFDRNDHLQRKFGEKRLVKYQYASIGQKVRWDGGLKRFLVHRTEVMSDLFNAIKRKDVIRFPDWNQFEEPFGKDILNIFSEYNEHLRQIQYKKSPDCTDDAFHSILLCFLASILRVPRMDVLNPVQKIGLYKPED